MVRPIRLTAPAAGLVLLFAAAAPPPAAVEQVAPETAMSIMGVRIQRPAGKDVGRLADVLVGQNGQPVAAVIDFGGFLGVGSRKVAVDWKSLKFSPGHKGHQITLELAPDQVRAAPEYKDQRPAPVVKSDATKPGAGKPLMAKPDLPKPEAAKPDVPKPDAAKPDTKKPDAVKPGTSG